MRSGRRAGLRGDRDGVEGRAAREEEMIGVGVLSVRRFVGGRMGEVVPGVS